MTPFALQPTAPPSPPNTPDLFVTKFPTGAPQAISISTITPIAGGNAGTVSPQITGTGFHNGATAQLKCGGQSIEGTNVAVGANGQLLNTTFNLAGTSPGACNVVVTNTDGTSATLSGGFTVQQGGAPNIQISIVGAESVEAPYDQPAATNAVIVTTVQNTGNVDLSGGVLSVPLPSPFELTSANPPDLAPQFSTVGMWQNGPVAAGSAQNFTGTAIVIPPVSCSGYVLKVQSCYYPPSINVIGFDACLQSAQIYQILGINPSCAAGIQTALATTSIPCLVSVFVGGPPAQVACIITAFATAVGAEVNCAFYNANPWPAVPYCLNANTSFETPPVCTYRFVPCDQASDPNNLVGPTGVGGQQWVTGTQPLSYVISFGNDANASEPAQTVVVTQPLGPNINLSTLGLVAMTIPNGTSGATVQVPVPAGAFNPAAGVDEFTTTVDLRPTQSLLVSVNASLNANTKTLTWVLQSIDPATGQPPLNPQIGFLPPGVGGNVAFTIKPAPVLGTGSQISDQASVVFNANAPLSTPTWTNTVDNAPPASQISALPTASTCPAFRVSWSGTDVGSGVGWQDSQSTHLLTADSTLPGYRIRPPQAQRI